MLVRGPVELRAELEALGALLGDTAADWKRRADGLRRLRSGLGRLGGGGPGHCLMVWP